MHSARRLSLKSDGSAKNEETSIETLLNHLEDVDRATVSVLSSAVQSIFVDFPLGTCDEIRSLRLLHTTTARLLQQVVACKVAYLPCPPIILLP